MKKTIIITSISTIFVLTGCVNTVSNLGNNLLHTLRNKTVNIKPDTTAIIASANTTDSDSVIGKGDLILKNIDTNEEVTISASYNDNSYIVKKVTPGTYKIVKWNYDSCYETYNNSNICKEWHDFGGISPKLASGNTFRVNKGDIVYLGHINVDSANKTLSISDNYYSDINNFKNNYDALKTRDIKDVSNNINVHNWGFKITGAGFFK